MQGVSSPDAMSTRHQRHAYGTTAVLNFFFHRVTRSGPRLLLYLAMMLASSLVVTHFLPTGVSDRLATTSAHLWELRPGLGSFGSSSSNSDSSNSNSIPGTTVSPGDNNEHDALVGGGLRIVVFGENDIATDAAHDTSPGTAWTRELCIELGCTTYLSYVPEAGHTQPHRSLSNNALYDAVIDDYVHEAQAEGTTPAGNFSYVKEAYPSTTRDAADLGAQVAIFLQQPAPRRAPKESIYVFSFGMWDVWSLAAFPYGRAENILHILVADLFASIETLLDAAHDPRSVAYSNHTLSPLAEANATTTATTGGRSPGSTARGPAKLIWDEADTQPFRVVMPLLFDPSLVPGWHLSRPEAPPLHTMPEHLRNAVRLTKRWNDLVMDEMDKWVEKGISFVHPADRSKPMAGGKEADDEKKNSKQAPPPPNISGRDENAEGDEDTGDDEDASLEKKPETTYPGQPVLKRDGIIVRLSDYVMDAIIDRQLKKVGIADCNSFGKFSKVDSYAEVDKPCLMPSTVRVAPASGKITTEVHGAQYDKQPDDTAEKRAPLSGLAPEQCEHPDDHLFYTPFSLGQRAIAEVGRMSAAVVRANRSTRSEWEQTSRVIPEIERAPGSWKAYYMPS